MRYFISEAIPVLFIIYIVFFVLSFRPKFKQNLIFHLIYTICSFAITLVYIYCTVEYKSPIYGALTALCGYFTYVSYKNFKPLYKFYKLMRGAKEKLKKPVKKKKENLKN